MSRWIQRHAKFVLVLIMLGRALPHIVEDTDKRHSMEEETQGSLVLPNDRDSESALTSTLSTTNDKGVSPRRTQSHNFNTYGQTNNPMQKTTKTDVSGGAEGGGVGRSHSGKPDFFYDDAVANAITPAPTAFKPKPAIDLFLIMGQSNAQGYATIQDLQESQKVQEGMIYNSWHMLANNAATTQYFSDWAYSLKAGWTRPTPYSVMRANILKPELDGLSTNFGIEMGFMAKMKKFYRKKDVGIFKYAVDGSALMDGRPFASDWNPEPNMEFMGKGDAWKAMKIALKDAVDKLSAENIPYHIKGMLWWQGESGTSVEGLNRFIPAIRELVAEYGVMCPDSFPIVITGGEWGDGYDVLNEGVAQLDRFVDILDLREYGQTNVEGIYNLFPGQGGNGAPTDFDKNGNNDIWDAGVGFAEKLARIIKHRRCDSQCVCFSTNAPSVMETQKPVAKPKKRKPKNEPPTPMQGRTEFPTLGQGFSFAPPTTDDQSDPSYSYQPPDDDDNYDRRPLKKNYPATPSTGGSHHYTQRIKPSYENNNKYNKDDDDDLPAVGLAMLGGKMPSDDDYYTADDDGDDRNPSPVPREAPKPNKRKNNGKGKGPQTMSPTLYPDVHLINPQEGNGK